MEIITGTTEFLLEKETAVAIGKFDGVHIGHRRLLEEIIEKKKDGLCACVFTFDPSPTVFFGQGDERELCSREEKRLLLERTGIDLLVEFPLTAESAAMPAEKFVTGVLAGQLNASFVVAGRDLSFGAGAKGNARLLEDMAEKLDMEMKTIEKIRVEEGIVSSTMIRSFVEKGRMELVEKCLGIPYPVMGRVVHGNHLGHTIGFPTVNLIPDPGKILPPDGVYLSDVVFRGRRYRGITNVGIKPTVSKEKVRGVETYIAGFDEDIYGENIEIYLKEFRRPEEKYPSVEELKAQLMRDVEVLSQ